MPHGAAALGPLKPGTLATSKDPEVSLFFGSSQSRLARQPHHTYNIPALPPSIVSWVMKANFLFKSTHQLFYNFGGLDLDNGIQDNPVLSNSLILLGFNGCFNSTEYLQIFWVVSLICCSSSNPRDPQFCLLAYVYLLRWWLVFLLCPHSSRTNLLFLHAFHTHSCSKWSLFHLNFCMNYFVLPFLFSYHIKQFLIEGLNLPKRLQVPAKQDFCLIH